MFLKFTKMQGCGNDFMVVDLVSQYVKLRPQQIRKWSDRHFGIGFDQLLVIEPPQTPQADFRYRIFNPDGSEAQQCGNGARCFARFVRDKKLSNKKELLVETLGGPIRMTLIDRNEVRVEMGIPVLEPAKIPFIAESQSLTYTLPVDEQQLEISAVSMGNPHAVTLVPDLDSAPVARLGPLIERHPNFPQRVNAGFMQIVNRKEIKLRVYERGAGETLACGSGACAAVVAGRIRGLLDEQVAVKLPGGTLSIEWQGPGQPVFMTGPCAKVYEGRVYL